MKSQTELLADVLRSVAARMEQSVSEGYRSNQMTVEDLVDALQAIADELESNLVRQ